MKQLITMLLLAVATMGFAQDKHDFKNRTKSVVKDAELYAKKFMKTTEEDAFAQLKIKALEKAVALSEDDKISLKKHFTEQFPILLEAYKKYENGESAQAKVDLIKTLLKMEDETRSYLTDSQIIYYKSYFNTDYFNQDFFDFRKYCMPENLYYTYKKELL